MVNILEHFPTAKAGSDPAWYKGDCPECGRVRALSISSQSGTYFCHKCKHSGKIGGIKTTAAVNESSHISAQGRFRDQFTKILENHNLEDVWSDIALNPDFALGYTSTDKLQFGIYYKGNLDHIKNHKGRQYGKASNKIYPEVVLDKADESKYLWITEGEKDAITGLCHGLQAISFTSGAGAVPKDISKLTRFENVVIIYDNDQPGKDGSLKVAQKLNLEFPNMNIKIFKWDDREDKYDLTDFYKDGNTTEDLFMILDKHGYAFGENPSDFGGWAEINMLDYLDLDIDPIEWICKDIVSTKSVSMIAGADNTGKSILALQLAVSVAIGVPFMHFDVPRPRKVLLVQFEMADGMVKGRIPKILKHFSDTYPEKMGYLKTNLKTVLKSDLGELFKDKWESLRGNLQASRQNQYDLVIVDNLYTSTSKDISKNHEIKDVVSVIRDLVDTFDTSFMLINHHNKPIGESYTLKKEFIRGGKLLTDNLDFCVQVALAAIDPNEKLRIMKITKSRMESEFTNVPCGVKLEGENGELKFDWLGPLPNQEEMYYHEPKKNKNFDILEELLAGSDEENEVATIQVEGVLGDHEFTRRSVFRWIKRQVKLGTIEKSGHGKYKILKNELWNLLT